MRRIWIVIVLLTAMAAVAIVSAGSTGKISGRVVDRATGYPIVGVTVLAVGTNRGATTDTDGEYAIEYLEPGTYRLRFSHVDFSTMEITDLTVAANSTAVMDVRMSRKVTELDEVITVKGTRDILDKFVTDSRVTVKTQDIKCATVQSVDQLLEQVSGAQTTTEGEVFIRGGRAGEVSYVVGGVPLNEPLSTVHDRLSLVPGGAWPPVNGGTAIVNGQPFEAMFFEHYGVNPFVDTEDDHFSTVAADVDDASYVVARNYLGRGVLPPKEAVRVEEFVNHFSYDYESPEKDAFRVSFEAAPSRFGSPSTYLLRVGIKGRYLQPEQRRAANLVFVIDVSGSMACENRLGLVKRALRLLVEELRPEDRVGIVIYGSRGSVHMQPRTLTDRQYILTKIDELVSEGSTNADEGLKLGFTMAGKMFDERKNNRIILCSDGVANVGMTKAEDLLEKYREYIDRGVTLTTVGFGMGNYNDILMEKLGDKGNGHYAYVDDIDAARRVFVDNLSGTLEVIARDVKLQLDFNPRVVRSYRLLGYENRDVADEDFRDDTVDGGEIGSGHCTTALYEIKFHRDARVATIGTLSLRYKHPFTKEVAEKAYPILPGVLSGTFESTCTNFRLAAAAAEFAEILRESYWARDGSLGEVRLVAESVYEEVKSDEVLEFLGLVGDATRMKQALSKR